MKKRKLKRRIRDLERRVSALERQPQTWYTLPNSTTRAVFEPGASTTDTVNIPSVWIGN